MAETTGLSKELADLKGLLDADLIDASEYVAKKEGILGRVKTMDEAKSLSSSGLIDEEEQAKAYEQARNCIYAEAETLYQKSTIESVREAQGKFRSLGDWKNAPTRVRRCNERIANFTAEADAMKEVYKKLIKIGAIVAAIIIAVILVITQVVMPEMERSKVYDEAVALGNAPKAVAAFEALGDYKDSVQKIKDIKEASLKNPKVGDAYWLGVYERDGNTSNGKEDIVWRILAIENGKALLISEKALDCKKFNNYGSKSNDWETSDLKAWLEGDFKNTAFEAVDQAKLSGNPFCLSDDEANTYFKNDSDRMCAPTAYAVKQGAYQINSIRVYGTGACYWWLRSAGSYSDYAGLVSTGGAVSSLGNFVDYGDNAVRPALWVNL